MSRKYTKAAKRRDRAQLAAAEAFVETWADSGLSYELIDGYTCTLGCDEAEAYAGIFRSFGYTSTADQIIADHAEYDECDERHHTPCSECSELAA